MHTTSGSASKSAFGICEGKQDKNVYNMFSLLKFVRYAAGNDNGAEDSHLDLTKHN